MASTTKLACRSPGSACATRGPAQRPLCSGVPAARFCRTSYPGTNRRGQQLRALDIDFSDPDTLLALAGGVVGLGLGIGIPIFLVERDERDDERIAEIRDLNRATKEATGEYMSETEIEEMRPRRWTDRRDFQDDD